MLRGNATDGALISCESLFTADYGAIKLLKVFLEEEIIERVLSKKRKDAFRRARNRFTPTDPEALMPSHEDEGWPIVPNRDWFLLDYEFGKEGTEVWSICTPCTPAGPIRDIGL